MFGFTTGEFLTTNNHIYRGTSQPFIGGVLWQKLGLLAGYLPSVLSNPWMPKLLKSSSSAKESFCPRILVVVSYIYILYIIYIYIYILYIYILYIYIYYILYTLYILYIYFLYTIYICIATVYTYI